MSSTPRSISLRLPQVTNFLGKIRSRQKVKAHHIESNSGEPRTHPSIAENLTSAKRIPLVEDERFVCVDAVDVVKLLRAVRGSLYEKAESIGANALVEEQWSCTICGPKHRKNGSFRVMVRYSAQATRSSHPDPQRPVALENVRSVPGLMTVLSREE